MNLNSLSDTEIRLIPVTIKSFSDIKPTLEFYMGKNTPERKEFIMKNLVNEESMREIVEAWKILSKS